MKPNAGPPEPPGPLPGNTEPGATESEFEALARQGKGRGRSSAFLQLLLYLQESRRWWLLPVILALLLAGLLLVLGGSAAAPFIYTLF